MSDQPHVAGRSPVPVQLQAGKTYAFCTCGLSASQPFCDGSHKPTSFRPHKFTATADEEVWMCMCKQSGDVPRCDGSHNRLPPA